MSFLYNVACLRHFLEGMKTDCCIFCNKESILRNIDKAIILGWSKASCFSRMQTGAWTSILKAVILMLEKVHLVLLAPFGTNLLG